MRAWSPQMGSRVFARSSIGALPARRTMSAYESECPPAMSRPSSTWISSTDRPCNGDPGSATASRNNFCRRAVLVTSTADPTLAAVIDPAAMGASGMSLSPRSKRTFSNGSPSASAATCAITVYVPVPRSMVPLSTCADPSGSTRATAWAGEKFAGYIAVAIPIPTSKPPRVCDRGNEERFSHPNFRAPSS